PRRTAAHGPARPSPPDGGIIAASPRAVSGRDNRRRKPRNPPTIRISPAWASLRPAPVAVWSARGALPAWSRIHVDPAEPIPWSRGLLERDSRWNKPPPFSIKRGELLIR